MQTARPRAPAQSQSRGEAGDANVTSVRVDEYDPERRVAEVLDRRPCAGVAIAVVRDGSPEWFFSHGVADLGSGEPISEDTVFRIGSITKTFTAIAVLQLSEQGMVDLDAPANDYLRAFELIPAKESFRPTVQHLLTHTAGVGYWRRLADPVQPWIGAGDRAGRSGALPGRSGSKCPNTASTSASCSARVLKMGGRSRGCLPTRSRSRRGPIPETRGDWSAARSWPALRRSPSTNAANDNGYRLIPAHLRSP
jgi:Beta-lactamase